MPLASALHYRSYHISSVRERGFSELCLVLLAVLHLILHSLVLLAGLENHLHAYSRRALFLSHFRVVIDDDYGCQSRFIDWRNTCLQALSGSSRDRLYPASASLPSHLSAYYPRCKSCSARWMSDFQRASSSIYSTELVGTCQIPSAFEMQVLQRLFAGFAVCSQQSKLTTIAFALPRTPLRYRARTSPGLLHASRLR